MKIFMITLALVAVAHCAAIQDGKTVLNSVVRNFVNCGNSDLSLCMKEKALLVAERFRSLRQLKLLDGLTIINNEPHKEGRSLEPLSDDVKVRSTQITERLSERAAKLIENVDLEISFGDDDAEQESVGEARDGSKKKKKHIKKKIKMLLPLLQILKAKVALVIVGAVLIAAAAAVKLAILAKIAFIVKAFLIIKALISKHKHGQETWVSHEEVDHHGHHGGWDGGHGWEGGNGGGWGRASKDANNLAYSSYQQNKI